DHDALATQRCVHQRLASGAHLAPHDLAGLALALPGKVELLDFIFACGSGGGGHGFPPYLRAMVTAVPGADKQSGAFALKCITTRSKTFTVLETGRFK